MSGEPDLRLAEQFWAAYERAGYSYVAMARTHGRPLRTIETWKNNHLQGRVWNGRHWVKDGEPTEAPKAPAVVIPVDPVDAEEQRLKMAHERHEHRVYTQQEARTQIILRHLEKAIAAIPPVKVKPPYFSSSGAKRSPMTLVGHLGDFHYGEVVDPAEVMALNAYDPEIAARRLYRFETLVLTALDIIGRAHPIPELRLLMVGDMVSGAIHNEIAETNAYNLYEQWANLSLLLAQFVLRLAPRFEQIIIEGVPGNHGRMTQRPVAKNRYVNWDFLMYQTLGLMLADQPNVVCRFPRSPLLTTEIRGHTYLVWHGDGIKSWSGLPFYGVQRAVAKLMELMQAKQQVFEYAAVGHFHTGADIQRAVGKVLMNASLKGGDEYSVTNLYTYSPPSQLLYFMHAEHGITWTLDNELSHGDATPHPYTQIEGDSLADGYRAVRDAVRR